MHQLQQLLNSFPEGNLKEALTEGYDAIFEVSWDGIPAGAGTSSLSSLGGYQNIMKQVSVNPSAGAGSPIDRSFSFVNNTVPNTRDTAEETREQWKKVKYGSAPIKAKPNAFMKRTLAIADKHMPLTGEVDIPSAQRRYAMIYTGLNTGINLNNTGFSLG